MTKELHLLNNINNINPYIEQTEDSMEITFLLVDIYNALRIRIPFNKFLRETTKLLDDNTEFKLVWRRDNKIHNLNSIFIRNASEKRLIRTGHVKGSMLTIKGLHKLLQSTNISKYLSEYESIINKDAFDLRKPHPKQVKLDYYLNLFETEEA